MTEPKWTPGRWRVMEPVALDYRAPLIYGPDQESLVATAEGGGPKRAITVAEARANAFLIAAAPELYAALEEILDLGPEADWGDPVGKRAWRNARQKGSAALAKARGEIEARAEGGPG